MKCCYAIPGCKCCCNSCNNCALGWADRNRKPLLYFKAVVVLIALVFSFVAVTGLASGVGVLKTVPWMQFKVVNINNVTSSLYSTRIYPFVNAEEQADGSVSIETTGTCGKTKMTVIPQNDSCTSGDYGTTTDGCYWDCAGFQMGATGSSVGSRYVLMGDIILGNVWGMSIAASNGETLSSVYNLGQWSNTSCTDPSSCQYDTHDFPISWQKASSMQYFSTTFGETLPKCSEITVGLYWTAIMTVIFTFVTLVNTRQRLDPRHDTGFTKCSTMISCIMPIIFNSATVLNWSENCYLHVDKVLEPSLSIGWVSFVIALFVGNIPAFIIDFLIPVPPETDTVVVEEDKIDPVMSLTENQREEIKNPNEPPQAIVV